MAIDSQHLPEDPKILQKMVLDLMAQLDRESAERHKFEAMLRELPDARRNRKSIGGSTGAVRGRLGSTASNRGAGA